MRHITIMACLIAILSLTMMSTAVWADGATPTGMKVGNSTLVPLRYIAEWLGASVAFDTASNRITLHTETTSILLTINSAKALVGDKEYTLQTPAITRDGVTYVPLRFVAEGFHAGVQWDEAKQQATITNPASGKTLTINVSSNAQSNPKPVAANVNNTRMP